MIATQNGPWLICAALGLLAAVLVRGRRLAAGELWLMALLFVGALAVRLFWGLWGPLHVNGQGPLWVRGALAGPVLAASYGPGYFELFGWIVRRLPDPDRAVFAANAVLSGLCPPLLYAVARATGVGRGGALAAAIVLAGDAVVARTAASESYFSSVIVLTLAVELCLAHAVRQWHRGDRAGWGMALTAAGLFAATGARIHPVAYLPLALSPLIVFGAGAAVPWSTRLARTAVAALAVGGVVLVTSGRVVATALRTSPMAGHAVIGLTWVDWQVIIALLAVLVVLQRWLQPPWLALLGLASLAAMLATQNSFLQRPLWQLAYQRLFWPGVLLGAAPLLPRRLQALPWAVAAGAVAAAALLVAARPDLGGATTEQLEYGFLREALRDQPRDCTVAAVNRAGLRLWDIPSYLAPGHGTQRAVVQTGDLDTAPGDCLLYVRSSLCSSAEARGLCDSIEREARLERVGSRVLPAEPSYTGLPYDRPEVEVVVFRVKGHRGGVSDGAAISPAFAEALYARLLAVHESDGCRLEGLTTTRSRMTVRVRTPGGDEHPVEVASAIDGGSGDGWSVVASDGAQRHCAPMVAAIERTLAALGDPASVGATEPTR